MIKDVNIALDSFSLLICLMLLANQFLEGKEKTKLNHWFMAVLAGNIGMLLGNLSDFLFRGVPGLASYLIQTFFGLMGYYAAAVVLLFSMFGWIYSSISQKRALSVRLMKAAKAGLAVQLLLAVTLPVNRLCYLNNENCYVRGKLFFLTQLIPCTLYLMALFLMLRYFRTFRRRELVYMLFMMVLPVISYVVQMAVPEYSVLNVTISAGLIMLFTYIQSQRDMDAEKQMKQLIMDENRKLESLQNHQERLSEQLIEVLSGTVEAKDRYTKGHSFRVAQYAREIMYRLGGDEQAQKEAYYIGILHDVGKISVNDGIINKKGRLTEEEYEQIKLHTVAGYQILRGIDVIPDLAVGARWHHERYDGKGYPNGLEGENIPLVARIISVADAYDAMTSNRSYHSTMSQAAVREQIAKGMGTQFDPKIAQIMLDMIDEDMQYEMRQMNFNRSVNILLIDDDLITHVMLQHILAGENYSLTSAYTGQEGIDYLKETEYDLCLLDMEMPGMNGFEVLEWIRGNVRRLKVIFLTGDKDIETIRKSERLGAIDYITKPINETILKESVNSVLSH